MEVGFLLYLSFIIYFPSLLLQPVPFTRAIFQCPIRCAFLEQELVWRFPCLLVRGCLHMMANMYFTVRSLCSVSLSLYRTVILASLATICSALILSYLPLREKTMVVFGMRGLKEEAKELQSKLQATEKTNLALSEQFEAVRAQMKQLKEEKEKLFLQLKEAEAAAEESNSRTRQLERDKAELEEQLKRIKEENDVIRSSALQMRDFMYALKDYMS